MLIMFLTDWSQSREERFRADLKHHFNDEPTQAMVDIVNGFDMSTIDTLESAHFYIPFADTHTSVSFPPGKGEKKEKEREFSLRILATLYSSPRDLQINNINMRTSEILSSKDANGMTKWERFRKADEHQTAEIVESNEHDLAHIYGAIYWVAEEMQKVKPLTIEEIVDNDTINEEVRALLFSHPSMNLSERLTKVDGASYTDNRKANYAKKVIHYDLFKGELMDTEVAYVRTFDASTDRMFFLAVDTRHQTARDAVASLMTVPKDMVPHIKEIYRQGEKYVVTWKDIKVGSKEYEKKMKTTPVQLTGDQYFNALVYES